MCAEGRRAHDTTEKCALISWTFARATLSARELPVGAKLHPHYVVYEGLFTDDTVRTNPGSLP